jgi:hypothetical protein
MALKLKIRALTVAALMLSTGGQIASAQWIVFDPTSYAKSAVTAYESVNATAQRATSYVNQLQQYQVMLTNLKRLNPSQLALAVGQLSGNQAQFIESMGGMSKLRDIDAIANETRSVAGTLSNATASLASLKQLQSSLGGLNEAYSRRFEEARREGLSWQQYAAKEDLQIRSRVASAAFRAQEDINRMDKVKKDYEFAQDMAAKIPEAEGVQQSMGIMNTQMNRVVTQLAELNKGLSASLQSKSPADVLAEEQKKQLQIDNQRVQLSNAKIQRDAEQAALRQWLIEAQAGAK